MRVRPERAHVGGEQDTRGAAGYSCAVAAGGVAGATAGATAALHLSEERLRELFMLSLLVLGGSACRRAVINLQSMYRKRT